MNTTRTAAAAPSKLTESVTDPLAAFHAAVARAESSRAEVLEQVVADRTKLAELDAAALEDPSDKRIKSAIEARATLEVRERALASREGTLAAATEALAAERRRLEHIALLRDFPLAFERPFREAVAPVYAAIAQQVQQLAEQIALLQSLSAEAKSASRKVESECERVGMPSEGGGYSFRLSSTDAHRQAVLERFDPPTALDEYATVDVKEAGRLRSAAAREPLQRVREFFTRDMVG